MRGTPPEPEFGDQIAAIEREDLLRITSSIDAAPVSDLHEWEKGALMMLQYL